MAREQEGEGRKIGWSKKKKVKTKESALLWLNRERAGKRGKRGGRDRQKEHTLFLLIY